MSRRVNVGYRIGELAASAAVTIDTLRYYEREGLLPKAPRTAGGFRVYPPDALSRVRLIKQAQKLGLTLREIRKLFGGAARPDGRRCADVRAIVAVRLADVERQMAELAAFRTLLHKALEECDEALRLEKNADCPVLEHLTEVPNRDVASVS